jgi:peptidoglycan-associated lipoprotein
MVEHRSGLRVRRVLAPAAAIGLAGAALAGCANHGARPPAPIAVAHSSCSDVVFPIYFAQGSDQLTQGADQVISAAVGQVAGCRIGYVNVLGLTDALGTRAENLDLSRRRADTVAKALAAAGLKTPKFEVEGVGENGAISEKGRPVPLRRKTEVIIHPLPA